MTDTAADVTDEPLIRVRRLTRRFGTRLILDSINLDVVRGQTLAIIGPSGGGKSTLLRCMNGLDTFQEGTVSVNGLTLSAAQAQRGGGETGRMIRRQVGMIFQDFQLFPHLTVLQNITLAPQRVGGQDVQSTTEQARRLLQRVGLGDRGDAFPNQLSGGQKQRVAIARALAMQPQALLCDEITSALDPELKHEVLEVVEALKRDGMTLIMVTHEMGFARRAADRVIVLADGAIIEDGPAEAVLTRPSRPRTQQFLERVLA